jgi:hypothetical protein
MLGRSRKTKDGVGNGEIYVFRHFAAGKWGTWSINALSLSFQVTKTFKTGRRGLAVTNLLYKSATYLNQARESWPHIQVIK